MKGDARWFENQGVEGSAGGLRDKGYFVDGLGVSGLESARFSSLLKRIYATIILICPIGEV